jgi:CHASE3 domain sensor protein
MRSRGLRFALVGLFVLAQAVAGWRLWTAERERETRQEAARTFDAAARRLLAGVADLRSAQQAYVVAGQGEAYWLGRVTTLLAAFRAGLADARTAATSPAGAQALETAADLLTTFAKTDEQVRGFLRSDQRLMASDLIFGESTETLASCAARIEEAQAHGAADQGRWLQRTRSVETWILGGAAAVGLVCLLLLVPLPQGQAPRSADVPRSTGLLASAPPLPAPAHGAAPDLTALARLCGDFSRAGDPAVLPALVRQAAAVLNASGVIVWMVNPTTRSLQPVLTYGYTELALARIGELAPDEDNATAESFRTGEARIVKAGNTTNGAIVAPLVTPAGCVGVLAAEIRNGGEMSAGNQAIAAIVAAQLASLTSSSPPAPEPAPAPDRPST